MAIDGKNKSNNKSNNKTNEQKNKQWSLLAKLSAVFYGVFTLLPDSHSLMVSWPWVFVWQVGLLCPILWWLYEVWQSRTLVSLGKWCNIGLGILLLALGVSTLTAEFPSQAMWYSWAALGIMVVPYALSFYLDTPQRRLTLLTAQGYLCFVFMLVSLSLWATQTWLPELERLGDLKALGLTVSYNFSVLELRNWAPIGHQNYVAGYLLLSLPLCLGLALIYRGWHRWFWLLGVGVGVLNLYTTSSRAGWLGLSLLVFAVTLFAILRLTGSWRQQGLIAIVATAGLVTVLLSNNRLIGWFSQIAALRGQGEVAFRLITNVTGWRIGIDHWLTGAGLGSVPMLYQHYRPAWAGRSAEWVFQLHSTPAQLWAELGIWGMGVLGWAIILILGCAVQWWRHQSRCITTARELGENPTEASLQLLDRSSQTTDAILTGSLLAGLLAYSPMALTDFQLDVPAIAGFLSITMAVLGHSVRATISLGQKRASTMILAATALVGAMGLWLLPIHRAWQVSSQGFLALQGPEPDLMAYQRNLEQAIQLAPWEPYYPAQLGWQLGEMALSQNRADLLPEAISHLESAMHVSPYQEFGYSALGWLQLRQGTAATETFTQASQLVSAKRGVFWALGVSLLVQEQRDLAIDAFALEMIRHPETMISPQWQAFPFLDVYPQVLSRLDVLITDILNHTAANTISIEMERYLQQVRGIGKWWQQDFSAAQALMAEFGTVTQQGIVSVTPADVSLETVESWPQSPLKLIFLAWLQPEKRESLLSQVWLLRNQQPMPDDLAMSLITSMEQATSLYGWLTENPIAINYRHTRSGFGVLSRHIDGSIPTDFLDIVDNVPIQRLLPAVMPSLVFAPELDTRLQIEQETLVRQLKDNR